MTKPTTATDLSDVYMPSVVKPLLESVLTELHTNTVFTRMFDEMMPQGFDVTKMDRLSQSRYKNTNWSKLVNTSDGVHRMGRLLATPDNITIRLTLHRFTSWFQNGYHYSNKFKLRLQLTDSLLVGERWSKTNFGTMYFATEDKTYDGLMDFEAFVLTVLANDFNTQAQDIIDTFNAHKATYKNIHALTGRYP